MKDNTVSLFRTFVVVFAFSLLSNHAFSQDFKPQPLITIPGKNTNLDVISAAYFSGLQSDTYICWQNQNDSLYSIYLKRIVPFDSNNVKIFSSVFPSIKPSIWKDEWAQQDTTIHIAWQSLVNNHWQIKSAIYKNRVVGNTVNITDSLTNNTDPHISSRKIVWIRDSNLVIAPLDSAIFKRVILDSGECANPCIQRPYSDNIAIAYEKGEINNKQIFLLQEKYYPSYTWQKKQITSEGNNVSPNFGPDYHGYQRTLSFISLIGNVWKIIISFDPYSYNYQDTSGNVSCNYYNPEFFEYPMLTPPSLQSLSFPNDGSFYVFDSDSIFANREIFIQYTNRPYQWPLNSQPINLSNMAGDDTKPRVFFINDYGVYTMIIWEHMEGGNIQFWSAKNYFRIPRGVEDNSPDLSGYSLSQNYPNPFNPSTKIRYTIPAFSRVKLQIFDMLGNEIALLANEAKPQGSYEAELNASDYNLSSGIYFYRIQAGKFFETKKLIFLQ